MMDYGRISSQDWEQISAYLDGQLANQELARFQSRLKTDPDFSAAFEEMRRTQLVLRNAPKLRAPRNYMLRPDMVKVRSGRRFSWFQFPSFSFASAVTGLLLLVLVLSDVLGIVHRVLPDIPAAQAPAPMAFEMEAAGEVQDNGIEETLAVEAPQLGIEEMRQLGTPTQTEGPMMALEAEEEMEEPVEEGEAYTVAPDEEAAEVEETEEMMGAASSELEEPAGGGGEPPRLGPTETTTPTPTLEVKEAAEATLEEELEPTLVAIEPQFGPTPMLDSDDGAAETQPEQERLTAPRTNLLGLFVVRLVEVGLAAMTIVFLILGLIYRRQRS